LPRTYRLGRRAEQMSETRAAIVRAALELIRTGGLRAATVPAIAAAADIAPATVRNHFPDQPAMLTEVGEMILADLDLPDTDIFDGLDAPGDRVARLARELVAFYGRGQEWWFVLTGDASMSPAFEHTAGMYEERFDRLVGAALGPLAHDPVAVAVVAAVIGPPLHYALIGRGLAPAEVVESSLAMLLPWLEVRGRPRLKPASTRRVRG
jgi:AcrR family transcriptional regulator